MDTKPIVKTLALPPLFKEIIEIDKALAEVMQHRVVPFAKTSDFIKRKKRLRRAAERVYFPSKKEEK